MPHPDPERRTNAPPGPERMLAGLTPEQAQRRWQLVVLWSDGTQGEAHRWNADGIEKGSRRATLDLGTGSA